MFTSELQFACQSTEFVFSFIRRVVVNKLNMNFALRGFKLVYTRTKCQNDTFWLIQSANVVFLNRCLCNAEVHLLVLFSDLLNVCQHVFLLVSGRFLLA